MAHSSNASWGTNGQVAGHGLEHLAGSARSARGRRSGRPRPPSPSPFAAWRAARASSPACRPRTPRRASGPAPATCSRSAALRCSRSSIDVVLGDCSDDPATGWEPEPTSAMPVWCVSTTSGAADRPRSPRRRSRGAAQQRRDLGGMQDERCDRSTLGSADMPSRCPREGDADERSPGREGRTLLDRRSRSGRRLQRRLSTSGGGPGVVEAACGGRSAVSCPPGVALRGPTCSTRPRLIIAAALVASPLAAWLRAGERARRQRAAHGS